MMVVVNKCYGGFSLSEKALEKLRRVTQIKPVTTSNLQFYYYFNRHDENLVSLLKEDGTDEVSGESARLFLEEWPDGIPYKVHEYDGQESLEVDIKLFLQQIKEELLVIRSITDLPAAKKLVDLERFLTENG
jgi:hypothetical protein